MRLSLLERLAFNIEKTKIGFTLTPKRNLFYVIWACIELLKDKFEVEDDR